MSDAYMMMNNYTPVWGCIVWMRPSYIWFSAQKQDWNLPEVKRDRSTEQRRIHENLPLILELFSVSDRKIVIFYLEFCFQSRSQVSLIVLNTAFRCVTINDSEKRNM